MGVIFSVISEAARSLAVFVTDIIVLAMGMFDFVVENSTLASRPWKDGRDYWCSFELYPEWKGNRFYVFKGVAHHRRQYMTATDVVIKTFRHLDATPPDWTLYKRACVIGTEMSRGFNQHLSRNGSQYTIKFVTPTDVVMDNVSDVMPFTRFLMRFKKVFSEDESVIFEEHLDGEFKTFVTQSGRTCEIGSYVLESFCHFTFHQSEGKILFSQLKGILEDKEFVLTCPVIHSTSRTFGSDDKGMAGILEFFNNHKCTGFCQHFAKPETDRKIVQPSAPVYPEGVESTDAKETEVSQEEPAAATPGFSLELPKYESTDPNRPPPYESCVQTRRRNQRSPDLTE